MTGPLDRAAAFVLAPGGRGSVAPTAVGRAVVVGTDQAARPLAAALALTLRAADRAPAALVAVWRAAAPGSRRRAGRRRAPPRGWPRGSRPTISWRSRAGGWRGSTSPGAGGRGSARSTPRQRSSTARS